MVFGRCVIMTDTFWIMVSAIATAVMAIATFVTIAITLHQNREAVRARLLFSIVHKDDYVLLKVSNVGNSVATNVQMHFSKNFHDMLMTDARREMFRNLENTAISIDAQKSKYYHIIPAFNSEYNYFKDGDSEQYSLGEVKKWHREHNKEVFEISGKYNRRYHFRERLSIYSFLNVGAVEINEVAAVLHKQNEILNDIKKRIN